MSGAAGRCFAAFGGLGEKQIVSIFTKIEWDNPIDYPTWRQQVEQTKLDGHSVDRENFVAGVSAIAVPVMIPGRPVSNTIGIYAITAQLQRTDQDLIVTALKEAAEILSSQLG